MDALAAHFPGLAPALEVVRSHVLHDLGTPCKEPWSECKLRANVPPGSTPAA